MYTPLIVDSKDAKWTMLKEVLKLFDSRRKGCSNKGISSGTAAQDEYQVTMLIWTGSPPYSLCLGD